MHCDARWAQCGPARESKWRGMAAAVKAVGSGAIARACGKGQARGAGEDAGTSKGRGQGCRDK
eukprot:359532-Chlamydomonas_euryale.AAC.1